MLINKNTTEFSDLSNIQITYKMNKTFYKNKL
jgi:hypothetical protein